MDSLKIGPGQNVNGFGLRGRQRMEAMLLDIPVHLFGTLCWSFLNAAHTIYRLLDHIQNIFTSCSTSTPGAFNVITVNALYKLITYLSQAPCTCIKRNKQTASHYSVLSQSEAVCASDAVKKILFTDETRTTVDARNSANFKSPNIVNKKRAFYCNGFTVFITGCWHCSSANVSGKCFIQQAR